MTAGDRSDVLKLWLFPAAAALSGAWIAPLFYNAGKALAEVSSWKTTNGPLEWLAAQCRHADFRHFHLCALAFAAALLLLPWLEWLGAGRKPHGRRWHPGPWRLPMGDGRSPAAHGQALRRYPRGLWHLCAGFLLAAGLSLPLGLALVPAGFGTMRDSAPGFSRLLATLVPASLGLAVLLEFLFRGLAMGIFLRAMRPSFAIAMTALYFAVTLSLIPSPSIGVADPDAAGTGWEMLGNTVRHLADGSGFVGGFLPLFVLGAVLAFARWRTASLWLPIGLHSGWLFARAAIGALVAPHAAGHSSAVSGWMATGVVPMAALVIAAGFAHLLTKRREDERPMET